jgi:four helix bundle protein
MTKHERMTNDGGMTDDETIGGGNGEKRDSRQSQNCTASLIRHLTFVILSCFRHSSFVIHQWPLTLRGRAVMDEAGVGRRYDLEERTAKFGEAVIDFTRNIPVNPVTLRLVPQLVAAATSVGANYCEADDAVSKRDFRHKIGICKKEARETKFFLRMMVRAAPDVREQAEPLWREAKELHLIFAKIFRRC